MRVSCLCAETVAFAVANAPTSLRFWCGRGNRLHPNRVELPQGVSSWVENSFVCLAAECLHSLIGCRLVHKLRIKAVIVVDGRADREKLVELMRQGEQTELEFKSTLDLKDRQKPDRLNFVKDVVALSNLPRGGYLLIGVKDDGTPVGMGDVNRDDWDGSCLRDIAPLC